MPVQWPSNLPNKQFLPIQIENDPGQKRTSMSEGPPKVRPTATSVAERFKIDLILDGSEKEVFKTFYKDDLNKGTKNFEWEHPVTDNTVKMEFINRPNFQMEKPNSKSDDRKWKAELFVMVQPKDAS